MSLQEHIRDNGVQNSENAVFVISWFNSPVIGNTVSRIFQLLESNNIAAFALEKPWHFSRKWESGFSLSWLQRDIETSIDYIGNQWFNGINMIGVSLSALPVVIASNSKKEIVKSNILLSPAFDPKKAIVNRWERWTFGIPFWKIPWLRFKEFTNQEWLTDFELSWPWLSLMDILHTNVSFDKETLKGDLDSLWARSWKDIKELIWDVPTLVIRNKSDQIISPRLIDKLWLEVTDGPTVDKTHHTISISEVSNIILEKVKWIFPETTELKVA